MRLATRFIRRCLVLAFLCACAAAAETEYDLSDPAEMVLAVEDNGTRYSWPLEYGRAREMVIEFRAAGKPEKALEAAKAQFILCPLDDLSVKAAIDSVKEVLAAADGGGARAEAFEQFARLGPAGPDGKEDTGDDLENPIGDVAVSVLKREPEFYREIDETMDARGAVGEDWQARWYQTEKIFARLNGGEFAEALTMLISLLSEAAKLPHANVEEQWELQRNQDLLDRLSAALGVYYRAAGGTTAGVSDFINSCITFARYGPAGEDGEMGTDDDLLPPV